MRPVFCCFLIVTGLLCFGRHSAADPPASTSSRSGNPLRRLDAAPRVPAEAVGQPPAAMAEISQPPVQAAPAAPVAPGTTSAPITNPTAPSPRVPEPTSETTASSEAANPVLPAAASPAPGEVVTAARIAEIIKAVRESTSLTEEIKADLLKRYQAQNDLLQTVEDSQRKIAQYEHEMQESVARIEKVRLQLAASPPDPTVEAYRDKNLAELETLLLEVESRLTNSRKSLAEREAELKNRAERRAELSKKVEETKQRVAECEQELTVPAPQGEAAELTAIRRIELETRRVFLSGQIDLYQAEIRRADKLAEFFPLQRDLVKRETNVLEKEVAHVQGLVDRARKLESERQAREARRQAELADPAIRDLAEHNATLAEKRKRIAEKITLVSGEVKEIQKQLDQLTDDFQRAQDKVDKAGHSTIVGLMLRRQYDNLPSLQRSEQRLRYIQRETPVISLDRLELEEQRTALGDLDQVQEQIMKTLDANLSSQHGEHLQLTVHELLGTKRDLLDKLNSELDAYLLDLSELETSNRELIQKADAFRTFIDEHVLWIRSAESLDYGQLKDALVGLKALANPQAWLELVKSSGWDTLSEPLMAAGVLAAVLLLISFHARLRRRIRALCETRSNSIGWKFLPSIRALLWTVVVTAEGPLLAWYVGWRMTSADHVSELGMALGPALQYGAALSWLSGFLRSICRPNGVAETFFDWPGSGLRPARHALRWLTWLGLPLASLVIITQVFNQGEWSDSLGRFAFVAVMLLLAFFSQVTLGGRRHVFREAVARDPKGWLSRMRWITLAAGLAIPAVLAVLAVIGYYYSAQQLAIRLQATLALGLVCLLVHAVVSRWFVVKRRRLAMEQARERQLAQQASQDAGDSAPSPLPVVASSETDWAAVHERLRVLLRHAVTVSVVGGIFLIWSDVLPALKILDRVELWSQVVEVTENYNDANDAPVSNTRREIVRTTLRHALVASVVLLATFFLGKNLPALLEITLLNRLPLDRGGRHAVSIILHYSVALAGMLMAFRTLSINWASVQWLAAGMTVGLGFGLQEIFANFVSGMILLFERPIRVGDIITLGDVTGTVTDIRIRATTVTNWDRKELIVPNKDLITGRLLNWTLSDTTNRIVINVGLAYHSDAAFARRVLYETVVSHPNILSDPAPAVTFESFGDSTLNFVIRGYLASLDVRLETVHELHVRLHQRLKKAGLEIAFPQRDLNIRNISWPASLASVELGSGDSAQGQSRRSDAA